MATFNNIDTFAELQNALTTSRNNGQTDTINLTGDITLTDNLPFIEEDQSLTINGGGYSVSGDDTYRPFFVESGTVVFDNLTFANGKAQGGDGAGGGAGMGGALFIYDGNVTVSNATFSNNQAIGGDADSFNAGGGLGSDFSYGTMGTSGDNGGFGGDGGFGGGGGRGGNGGDGSNGFDSYDGFGGDGGGGSNGGWGGFGGDGGFGGGGGFAGIGGRGGNGGDGGEGYDRFGYYGIGGNGGDGGFGGNGGWGGFGGFGGFGGGGGGAGYGGNGGNGGRGGEGGFGASGFGGIGGDGGDGGLGGFGGFGGIGGFGGGNGGTGSIGGSGGFGDSGWVGGMFGGIGGFSGTGGTGGIGSYGGGGAGMGGAIFVRSGSLTLDTVAFNNNQATGGMGGKNPDLASEYGEGLEGDDGQGLGGAIFVLHTTENSNDNNLGMPDDLPTVTVSNVSFSGNDAADATGNTGSNGVGLNQDNDDVFGTIGGVSIEDTFAMGETGTISNLTHTARTINLSRNYQNPVVFAQSLSYNGATPATVRLDNITANSFSVSVQEPNNEDGIHAAENLSFMVLEAGTWELADGTLLEVGTTDSNQLVSQGWETVNFNADFDTNPVVMSQIQTFNGADFVRTRQDDITENGFLVGMEEEEANATSGHANETIGYMAMSGGSGNWSGLNYTAGYSGDRITDNWGTVNFGGAFTQTPQVLASLASYDGADPAGIRYRNLNNNQVEFKVEEDTSANAEMAHTSENVSFLAIEGSGLLSASPVNTVFSAMGETGTISNLTHTAQTINLARDYVNPVVFAQPLSFNGSAPAAVRLDNITNNSFSVSVQEPNNEDGIHAAENLSFMVLEAGTWELADGTVLEVGTTDSNQLVSQGWETVNFDADFDNNPVVMSQIQTLNGADFVRTRQDNITENGFLVGMEEEEANATSGHANETIGYMAISGGSGNWSGLNYAAGYTGDNVTDAWETQTLNGFTQAPQILASLATYDGPDPAGIRYRNLNNNQVEFKVEEDTSADAEMTHTTENVSFLAIEGSGILEAVNIDPLAAMTAAEAIVASPETFTGSPEADTFVLGDATESYYDNMGIQDYALILNFDSSEDVIQLNGSASDYLLGAAGEEVAQGTGIFLNNNELVGVVSGVSDLALDADYFSFV